MVWPHPGDVILYARSSYFYNICLLYTFFDIYLILSIVLVFNPEKLWERLQVRFFHVIFTSYTVGTRSEGV